MTSCPELNYYPEPYVPVKIYMKRCILKYKKSFKKILHSDTKKKKIIRGKFKIFSWLKYNQSYLPYVAQSSYPSTAALILVQVFTEQVKNSIFSVSLSF